MATHSSILAWRIPWTEEPGELKSMGLQRAVHNRQTNTHTHTHTEHPDGEFKCSLHLKEPGLFQEIPGLEQGKMSLYKCK